MILLVFYLVVVVLLCFAFELLWLYLLLAGLLWAFVLRLFVGSLLAYLGC